MICPDCGGSPAMRGCSKVEGAGFPLCTHPCHQAAQAVVDHTCGAIGLDLIEAARKASRRGEERVPGYFSCDWIKSVAALLATLEEEQGRGKTGALLPPAGDGKVAGIAAHHAPTPSPAPSPHDVEAARMGLILMTGHRDGRTYLVDDAVVRLAQILATHARAAAERERERWAPALKALTRIAACDPDYSDPEDWPCRSAWHCQQHLEDGPDGGEPRCPECCSRWWRVDAPPGAGHPPEYWQDAWAAAAIRALPGEGE